MVSCLQMAADLPLSRMNIEVVTGVRDVLPTVAEDHFIRIVVQTSSGQTGPLQPQSSHQGLHLLDFDGMRRIAIQGL